MWVPQGSKGNALAVWDPPVLPGRGLWSNLCLTLLSFLWDPLVLNWVRKKTIFNHERSRVEMFLLWGPLQVNPNCQPLGVRESGRGFGEARGLQYFFLNFLLESQF